MPARRMMVMKLLLVVFAELRDNNQFPNFG
jgi:hypothetical protein